MQSLVISEPNAVEVDLVPDRAVGERLDGFLASVEKRALVMAEMASGCRDEGLDIVQEAMISFVTAYGKKPEQQWPALFYRVLQNKIKDCYRKRALRRRWFQPNQQDVDGVDLIGQASALDTQRPDATLAGHDAMEELVVALEALPNRQRQVVMLRIWEGLDVAQTAQAMGCSSGSVKTHLFRALRVLREKLEAHWL